MTPFPNPMITQSDPRKPYIVISALTSLHRYHLDYITTNNSIQLAYIMRDYPHLLPIVYRLPKTSSSLLFHLTFNNNPSSNPTTLSFSVQTPSQFGMIQLVLYKVYVYRFACSKYIYLYEL